MFFILCGKNLTMNVFEDLRKQWIIDYMADGDVLSQKDYLGGFIMWLDLKINQVIIGPILMFMGLVLCEFNFNA